MLSTGGSDTGKSLKEVTLGRQNVGYSIQYSEVVLKQIHERKIMKFKKKKKNKNKSMQ